MKTEFRISRKAKIVCEAMKTRNGFKHVAGYYVNGCCIQETKVCYLNRTWESFEYESVINKLTGAMNLPNREQKKIHGICQKISRGESDAMFKSVAMVAAMGDIFGKTQTDKNDWKARMLKAGLGNQGLSMPEDWDTLSEDEKERRLDGVIKCMKKE